MLRRGDDPNHHLAGMYFQIRWMTAQLAAEARVCGVRTISELPYGPSSGRKRNGVWEPQVAVIQGESARQQTHTHCCPAGFTETSGINVSVEKRRNCFTSSSDRGTTGRVSAAKAVCDR